MSGGYLGCAGPHGYGGVRWWTLTVPAWRGRGIFRALVAYRAGLAAARGYRYLQVDALPASRPILQRLGFKPVASTTPYVWAPPASR